MHNQLENTFLNKNSLLAFLMREKNLALLLIGAFFIIRLPYFLSDAFLPDELWHTAYMSDLNIRELTNYQGHGAGFWLFGYILSALFNESSSFLFALRLSSLMALCGASYCIFRLCVSQKVKHSLLILCTFLSLPMSWWGGKLIFPEFHSIFILALAIYWLFAEKFRYLPWLALGFCVGLKLTAAPVVIMVFLIYSFCSERNIAFSKLFWRQTASSAALIIIGFIICSPNLIWDTNEFLSNIAGNGSYQIDLRTSVTRLTAALFRESISWDLVNYAPINAHLIPISNLILLTILMLLALPSKVVLTYLSAIFAFVCMFSFNSLFYVWHAFQSSLLVVIPFALYAAQGKGRMIEITSTVTFLVVIVLNLTSSYATYDRNNESRGLMARNLETREVISQCVIKQLNDIDLPKYKITTILNRSEMGATSDRHTLLANQTLTKHVNYVSDHSNDIIFSGNYEEWEKSLSAGNSILVLNNQRDQLYFDHDHHFVKQAIEYVKNELQYSNGSNINIELNVIATCGTVDIIIVGVTN